MSLSVSWPAFSGVAFLVIKTEAGRFSNKNKALAQIFSRVGEKSCARPELSRLTQAGFLLSRDEGGEPGHIKLIPITPFFLNPGYSGTDRFIPGLSLGRAKPVPLLLSMAVAGR